MTDPEKMLPLEELTNVAVEKFEEKIGRKIDRREYAAMLHALGAVFSAIADFHDGDHAPTIGTRQ